MTKYDLTKILPHKPPMILLDDIIDVNLDEKTLNAIFKVYPEKLFYDRGIGGINSLVGIEFMAQTIGCYAFFKSGSEPPKPGCFWAQGFMITRLIFLRMERPTLSKSMRFLRTRKLLFSIV